MIVCLIGLAGRRHALIKKNAPVHTGWWNTSNLFSYNIEQ
jgi:hypothetical protein